MHDAETSLLTHIALVFNAVGHGILRALTTAGDRARAPDRAPARRAARVHPRRGADAAAREPDQAARRQGAAAGSDDRGARLVLPLGPCRLRGRDGGDPRSPLHEAGPASARLVGSSLPSRPPGWPGAAPTCRCTGSRTHVAGATLGIGVALLSLAVVQILSTRSREQDDQPSAGRSRRAHRRLEA